MNVSAKLDYSCKALLELALHWPKTEPLQISLISERQKIPVKFLTQILINLKQHGFVQSARGKSGGYVLAVSPREIKLSDVYCKLCNEEIIAKKVNEQEIFKNIWQEVDKCLFNKMKEINFEAIQKLAVCGSTQTVPVLFFK